MAPHREAQQADRHNGVHHGLVSEDRLARKGREHLRSHAHSRQDCDVNLRMTEEPEQVLPQQRRPAFVPHHRAVHNN